MLLVKQGLHGLLQPGGIRVTGSAGMGLAGCCLCCSCLVAAAGWLCSQEAAQQSSFTKARTALQWLCSGAAACLSRLVSSPHLHRKQGHR